MKALTAGAWAWTAIMAATPQPMIDQRASELTVTMSNPWRLNFGSRLRIHQC